MEPSSRTLIEIRTPFDDILPKVEDPSAQFYLDTMRIYLALSSGTISYEQALDAVEHLKKNPEFARSPTNPTRLPINKYFTQRIVDNLKTLRKFNLVTRDSIKSACSFAFLVQENPINQVDFNTLSVLVQQPRASFSQIAKATNLAPRTVSRSIKRLTDKHVTRFRALLDHSAWNIDTVIVFFTPASTIDWQVVENELITFPFLKTMLKTAMTDLGYISVNIPGGKENVSVFLDSIRALSKTIFDYVSIHHQKASSVERNLSLYKDGKWCFPEEVKLLLEDITLPNPDIPRRILEWRGPQNNLTSEDFTIASIVKLMSRSSPGDIAGSLKRWNLDADSKRVTSSIRKLINKNIMLPYVEFALGLTSDFCFEIVCSPEWVNRILSLLPLFPYVISFVSPRGIILWPSVPGAHQVEYYQLLRSLELQSGVRSVQSIMTITQKGSRSILDLAANWKYTKNGYTVHPGELDLTSFISEY